MDLTGSSEGCRYCGRPLGAAATAAVGGGPPQVLCASCRAASSLDALLGQGAFASGGLALKVPRAQVSPSDPGRPAPARDGGGVVPPPPPAPAAPSGHDDVVIDLTDRAVARAAEAAAALEAAPAGPPSGPERREPAGDGPADDPPADTGATAAAPEPADHGEPDRSDDPPTGEAVAGADAGTAPGAEADRGSSPADPGAAAGAGAGPDADTGGAPEAGPPRRRERIPTIRDLTRSTGRPRSTVRRAEPLAPAPRRPATAAEAGQPASPGAGREPAPGLAAATWTGRGLRRPTVIDLRDGATPGRRSAAGPQWSGSQERRALRELLEGAAGEGVDVLHDRRAPGCLSAIDHLVVAPTGVWVVDSMGFSGRVRHPHGRKRRSRPTLHVGGRDRTPLLADVTQRVEAVGTALADSPAGRVPFRGALCFSDEDLGRDAEPFELAGTLVTSRRHLLAALTAEPVVDDAHRAVLLHTLAERLPPIA